MRSITQFERGEALIHSNNNKVPVVIKASVEEKENVTTDRAELEAILRKRQKKPHNNGRCTHFPVYAYNAQNKYKEEYKSWLLWKTNA